jgi:2-polyprenyl-6-methoxyphenol hydroxylase-like FAD-dependent oxidoreductase
MHTAENFYSQEIVQVDTDTWSKGRVVLLGDAGYCPSPMSAMGTTGSFVGAYVLAGEINRNSDDLPKALANYDKVLRPFVKDFQKINGWFLRLAIPDTHWGIAILHWIVWLVCLLRIPELMLKFSSENKGEWRLPEYPSMDLRGRSLRETNAPKNDEI